MKFGAFLLGGIAGAAAAMLLRKQSLASMAGGMSRMMKSRGGSSAWDSRGKAISLLFGGGGEAASKSGQSESHSEAPDAGESGMEHIARIVSKDEGVKKEINEILEQNGQPHL